MKIKVTPLPTTLIGQRVINYVRRYYYTHADYPALLIVSQAQPLDALEGRVAIALFNFDGVDSTIVCDVLPDAPQEWRAMRLVQCTVKVVSKPGRGKATPLDEALREMLA